MKNFEIFEEVFHSSGEESSERVSAKRLGSS